MKYDLFHEKLRIMRMEGYENLGILRRFTSWFNKASDWDLYRINPMHLAGELKSDEHDMINFFVHGARVGLFDFTWRMVCPSCGEIQNNDHSLNALSGHFTCVVCQAPVSVNIDDTVEVTFFLNPSIRKLTLNPFENADTYRTWHFSPAVDRNPSFLKYMSTIWEGFESIPPGETLIIDRSRDRGISYRLVSAGIHTQFLFHIDSHATDEVITYDLDFGETGILPTEMSLKSLSARLRIHNRREETVGIMIVKVDFPTLHKQRELYPSQMLPMLTGNQLLNNQLFRELYDHTGDVDAYGLIQEHFKLLSEIVARHSGAVIKTMGDAVMASFSRPIDGVRAAAEMLEKNKHLTHKLPSLGLKIGLHEGPALAISNQGSLDYFGQTVNIAARVQGLAGPESLWMTESVLQSRGVGSLLQKLNFRGKRYQASLKGVGIKTTVYELKKKEIA